MKDKALHTGTGRKMAYLTDSFLLELNSRCDIEAVVSSYVTVKKFGKNLKGLCPFHNEKTPSFTVFPSTQSFYCFGCGAGGGVINFISKIENLEYLESVKLLCERYGMKFPEKNQDDGTSKRKLRIYEANRIAARFFYNNLMSENGKTAREYLVNRKLSKATVKKYGIGYAGNSFNSLCDHLKGNGFSEFEIVDANLGGKGKNGGVYDLFRDRIMFPIIDLRSNVIGFGGRELQNSKTGRKYLNTSDTLCFKKSHNLYNLNFAKNSKEDKMILAEGYMDVIAMAQAGFENVVATLGTSLTDAQARLISKYAKEAIIAYDSDEAGLKATARATTMLEATGLKCSILTVSDAKDPDEYIKKHGRHNFEKLIKSSAGIYEHKINVLKEKYDLDTLDGKNNFLKDAMKILADASPVEKELFSFELSKTCDISAKTILSGINSEYKKTERKEKKKFFEESKNAVFKDASHKYDPDKFRNLKVVTATEELIFALCQNPKIYESISDKIDETLFSGLKNEKLYSEFMGRLSRKESLDINAFAEELSENELHEYSKILAKNSEIKPSKEEVFELLEVIIKEKEKKEAKEKGLDGDFNDIISKIAKNKEKA